MANTTIVSGLQVDQWSNKFFKEYVRENRFYRYMSASGDNVIAVNKELSKKAGDNITFGLVMELSNSAVEGDDSLDGNEENLDNYSDTVTVNQLRNGVKVGRMEQKRTLLQVLEHARERLKKWAMAHLRDELVDRFTCYNLDGTTTFAASTATERDAALAANTDRVLFGALLSNRSTTDHSASLLNVDTTADTFDEDMVSLLQRVAEGADPRITPLTVSEDEEWWVAFCGTEPRRDLKAALDALHLNSAPRDMKTNPIYRDGDLVYNATIIRKIPEMDTLGTLGASSAPIYNVAFCGQQALCLAWAKMTQAIRNGPEGQDYGNQRGVGICEIRGSKKTVFNSVFHGMVDCYVAAAADA
jgi:N4-gp56 family major capsid protein